MVTVKSMTGKHRWVPCRTTILPFDISNNPSVTRTVPGTLLGTILNAVPMSMRCRLPFQNMYDGYLTDNTGEYDNGS